jgi:hypothetical protein
MLTGFSFTARVWGKLLLGMPKSKAPGRQVSTPRRASARRLGESGMATFRGWSILILSLTYYVLLGVELAALGGEGSCSNCGYISFQEQAFEQLVLDEGKKELIRAVARNAGNANFDEDDDDDDDDVEEVGIDVVANKGGASIFLLHGPPGCGKTLTAEAIAELLKKVCTGILVL